MKKGILNPILGFGFIVVDVIGSALAIAYMYGKDRTNDSKKNVAAEPAIDSRIAQLKRTVSQIESKRNHTEEDKRTIRVIRGRIAELEKEKGKAR